MLYLFLALLFQSTPLTWTPPVCGDATHTCADLNITAQGHQNPSLNSGTDYRLHLPAGMPQSGGLTISGGRNVILKGGQINLSVPCSDAQSACHGINISKPTAGSVFIEGVYIHGQITGAQSTGDGIDVDDTLSQPNDITLQNVRIDGISGCSGGADHADVFQPYAAPNANIRIDRLTGETNCQGLQVDPDLAWSRDKTYPKSVTLKNVNVKVLPNPYSGSKNRYAYWLTYGLACNSGPITLTNVYSEQPTGNLAIETAWPDTDQPAACKSIWNGITKQLTFPASPQIKGVINAGTPVNGDFVPVGLAGIGYISPGYGNVICTVSALGLPTTALTDAASLLLAQAKWPGNSYMHARVDTEWKNGVKTAATTRELGYIGVLATPVILQSSVGSWRTTWNALAVSECLKQKAQ